MVLLSFTDSEKYILLLHKYKFVIWIQNQIVSINYQRLLKCVILFGKSMGFLYLFCCYCCVFYEKGWTNRIYHKYFLIRITEKCLLFLCWTQNIIKFYQSLTFLNRFKSYTCWQDKPFKLKALKKKKHVI